MIAESRKVLTMLYENKINVEEAEELLDALEQAPKHLPEPEIEIITADLRVHAVWNYARKAGSSDAPVLIVGEAGTGKELIARFIHQNSHRRDKAFLFVNCDLPSGFPLDGEIFGYTFREGKPSQGLVDHANGGTLFFDEIGDLPFELQVKLLRFAETGEFHRCGGTEPMYANVRIITATNKELQAEVDAGRFHRELFECLNTIMLKIPPLRERIEDIPLLANYFLKKYATQAGRTVPVISTEAMLVLMGYPWSGNVRELAKAIRLALVLADKNEISPEHLIALYHTDIRQINQSNKPIPDLD